MIPEPNLLEDRELSFHEKCLHFIKDCYPEQILRNSAFIIVAVVAAIFSPPLACVFAIAASSQLLTVCALKIYAQYDEDVISKIQLEVLNFQKNYPFLQIVAFLITIAVFFIFPLASVVLGALLGFYVGLISDATYYKRLQTIPDDFLL